MTRQPSTRTAEPRTFDLSPTQCPHCWHVHMDYNDEACVSCGCEYAIRDMAEAAAPAGLDVDVLRTALDNLWREHYGDSGLPDGSTTVGGAYAEDIAAEYARLRQGTEGER